MKTLTSQQMQRVSCGSAVLDAANAFCAFWGLARFAKILMFTNPASAVAAEIADAACLSLALAEVIM